jgi:hypothetical protein
MPEIEKAKENSGTVLPVVGDMVRKLNTGEIKEVTRVKLVGGSQDDATDCKRKVVVIGGEEWGHGEYEVVTPGQ